MDETFDFSEEQMFCLMDRKWWVFLLSGILTWAVLLTSIIVWRIGRFIFCHFYDCFKTGNTSESSKGRAEIEADDKNWAGRLASGETKIGKFLVVLNFYLSLSSFALYVKDTTDGNVEYCQLWTENIRLQIDIAFNVFFMVYFFIRFIAARNKLKFMFELYSVVDVLTVPPTFVPILLDRTWLGLRCLRAIRFMCAPEAMKHLNILKTSSSIRIAQLIAGLASVVFTGSGIIHLLENSGDPLDFRNPQELSYWTCVYFLITVCTIGYGDIQCQTTLGRAYMVFFILVGLAVFAAYIPELIELVGTLAKYTGEFHPAHGKRHIVLCGNINHDSVSHFLEDFLLREDRGQDEIKVVILHRTPPDQQLESLLKVHFKKVEFFKGTAMNSEDLQRVKVHQADACLVLANKCCQDQDAEDAANIMEVASIKNFKADMRVIVQLIHYHNKTYLLNIPSWNCEKGDDVICMAELKLGLIARSCLAPGFSTIAANLISMRSHKTDTPKWQCDYLYGARMEMHTQKLSPSFVGMTFPQAVELCFVKLKILLVAIEVVNENGSKIYVNPGNQVKLTHDTKGFLVAKSKDEAERVYFYCENCHEDIRDEQQIRKCKCVNQSVTVPSRNGKKQVEAGPEETKSIPLLTLPGTENRDSRCSSASEKSLEILAEDNGFDGTEMKYDSTGMFHWCPARDIEDCILDRKHVSTTVPSDHIVLCLIAEKDSPLIGLWNFVMPLRTSNLSYQELKHVVIVGNVDFIRKEWEMLQNLPKISILNGSPLRRADLRSVKINKCLMCVILSAKVPEDPSLADKEAILATVNIKAMNFALHESVQGGMSSSAVVLQRRNEAKNKSVPIITELINDIHVQFLDQNDHDPNEKLYQSQPFACGTAFADSVLDSLMSATYFNADALALLRCLITGGSTPELELILAEGAGLHDGNATPESLNNRDRCRIGQISLQDIAITGEGRNYGEVFIAALKNYGMLCIGLYRNIEISSSNETSTGRYVITNPSAGFHVVPSDKVFVLMGSEPGTIRTERSEINNIESS